MSSLADDSSVDDSVSSVGPDGWEAIERLVDDDSDDPPEPFSRLATPIIDAIRQSAILPPPESVREAAKDEDEDDLTTPVNVQHPDKEPDVSILWDGNEVTFQESDKQQDVTRPWADIRGSTAESFMESAAWSNLDRIHGSLRMKLAAEPLSLDRPLRVFYVGSEEHQGEIEAKIGSALFAGRRDKPSPRRRRSVLPMSLNNDSPQVALVPDSGTNMEIETCVRASHVHEGQEMLKIGMDSGAVFKSSLDVSSGQYILSGSDWRPDLAVIVVPEDEARDTALRLRARVFLNRHSIPTIIISSDKQWQEPSRPLVIDTRSPHFVVHAPGPYISETTVLRRLPVDVDTFLQINSVQLNRSFASMLADAPAHKSNKAASKTLSTLPKSEKTLAIICNLFIAAAALLGFVVMGGGSMFSPLLSSSSHAASVPYNSESHVSASPTSQAIAAVTTSSSTTPSALSIIPEKSLSLAQIAELGSEPNKSEKFTAEPLGQNTLVVRPPRWYLDSKRQPKLSFNVSRSGHRLDFVVSQLPDTKLYVINIAPEAAYGIIDVRISGSSRLLKVNETAHADMGSSYWKMMENAFSKLHDNSQTTLREAEPTPTIAKDDAVPKDRLAEDVRMLAAELTQMAQHVSESLKGRLVLSSEERLRIRQDRRQTREKRIEAFSRAVHRKKEEIKRAVQQNVQFWKKSVDEYKRTHFREQQKDLLKLWWRVSGAPAGAPEPKHGTKAKKVVR